MQMYSLFFYVCRINGSGLKLIYRKNALKDTENHGFGVYFKAVSLYMEFCNFRWSPPYTS